MNKFYLIAFATLVSNTAFGMNSENRPSITEKDCSYVLESLNLESEDSSLQSTYNTLEQFLSDREITDYASVVKYSRNNETFESPDKFSKAIRHLFIKNKEDEYPEIKTNYQALIFNTSGIDVFMERLAFLSRLSKAGIKADRLCALVGTHAHRKDLMNIDYLLKLPHLFNKDFSLKSFDENEAKKDILEAFEKAEWKHRDGMDLAWKLISSDKNMAELSEKFEHFDGNSSTGLRTHQLLELFISSLKNPIDSKHPIGFITNSQGSTEVKTIIEKLLPDNNNVDVLIARPVKNSIEAILFNDSAQQRALTKLFNFYQVLGHILGAA